MIESQPLLDRPAPWGKVALLRELLNEFDLVLWLDADAVVVDCSADIADALRRDADVGLVAHRRQAELVPNSGVLVLRRSGVAADLLERMWASEHLIDHPWWENAALCEALGCTLPGSLEPGIRGRFYRTARRIAGRELRPFRGPRDSPFLTHTQFLANEWNSIHGDAATHPRIVHFPASPLPDRLAAMKAASGSARL